MAISRLKLTNQQPLVRLTYHPYQYAFMKARQKRVCSAGHEWSYTEHRNTCPVPGCVRKTGRAYASLLLRAGRRGGKTRIGALAVIDELTIPNTRWWACAPTYPKLEDYVLPAFFSQLPKAWVDHPGTDWSESNLTLTLPNGSQVQFRSLEDADRGRGPGLDGVWIDEICELSLLHWETIEPALADRGGIVIATTSPKGRDWVHKAFYVPAEKKQTGFWAVSFTTLDNPAISAEFVERAKARMTDLMFRQEYMAELVTFEGAIYGELVQRCVIEGTDDEMRHYFPEWPNLDRTRDSIAGLDPGTDHPFGAIHAVQSPRGLVVTGEYLQRNAVFAIHAARVQELRNGFKGRVAIDRSAAQAQTELAQYGLYTVQAENDVQAGINRVASWMLRNKPGKMPSGLVLPRRYCPQLIEQLEAHRYAKNFKEDGEAKGTEQVYKKDDDLCDPLRYALMLYPTLPSVDPESAEVGKRDLSDLPDQVRHEIMRERQSRTVSDDYDDGGPRVVEGMGEFYYH